VRGGFGFRLAPQASRHILRFNAKRQAFPPAFYDYSGTPSFSAYPSVLINWFFIPNRNQKGIFVGAQFIAPERRA